MTGASFEKIPISSVAEKELQTVKDTINNMRPKRRGADVSAWIDYAGPNNASISFRVPYADSRHPSSIDVNPSATDSTEVFQPSDYCSIRFELIGERDPTYEKLKRRYSSSRNESVSQLKARHEEEIKSRERRFTEIVHSCSSGYCGIKIRTDLGEVSAPNGDYRPHVRLDKLDTSGEDFSEFLELLVTELNSFYNNLSHQRQRR